MKAFKTDDIDPTTLNIIKHVVKHFPAGTKFRSLYGGVDTVHESESFRIDKFGDVYIKGVREQRVIYSNGYWADTELKYG